MALPQISTGLSDEDWSAAVKGAWAALAINPTLKTATPDQDWPQGCYEDWTTAQKRANNLSMANERIHEISQVRQSKYLLNPRRCLSCDEPITWERLTKQQAKFCNRSCSAKHSNHHRKLAPAKVRVHKQPNLTRQELALLQEERSFVSHIFFLSKHLNLMTQKRRPRALVCSDPADTDKVHYRFVTHMIFKARNGILPARHRHDLIALNFSFGSKSKPVQQLLFETA